MSAHAAASTRRLASSLALVASALGMVACSGGSPTAPSAPAESNESTLYPERERVCKLPVGVPRPKLAEGFCPTSGAGLRAG